MLRMGRNPKDQPHGEDTADHTPQTPPPSQYGNAPASGNAPANSGATSAAANLYGQDQVHTPTTSKAVTESESLARDIKEGTLSGFVGNGTVLTGEASFKGMLRVDGHLSGRVSSQDGTLIISTNGQVDANIEVAVAQIFGTVNGDITATKRIEMGRVAKVTGNIQTPALVIENGALFEGSCRMMQIKETIEKRTQDSSQPSGASSATAASASTSNASSSSTPATGNSSSSSSTPDKSGRYDALNKSDKAEKAGTSDASSGIAV